MSAAHRWENWRRLGGPQGRRQQLPAVPDPRLRGPRWDLLVLDGEFVNGYLWRPGSHPRLLHGDLKQSRVAEPTELDDDALTIDCSATRRHDPNI